jgi:hypothetical protein
METEPGETTDDQSQPERGQLIRSLVQLGEILLKVFLATALTIGVLRGGEVEANGALGSAAGDGHRFTGSDIDAGLILGAPYETIGIVTT